MLGRGWLGFPLFFVIACSGAKATDLNGAYAEGPGAGDGANPPSGSGHGEAPPATPGHPNPPPVACTADPSKYDFPGNGVDEDCSGKADDEGACDDKLAEASSDPLDAAKALGLCRHAPATGTAWGVISAKWVRPDGTALPATANESFGLLTQLGATGAKAGKSMLAISSGAARAPGDEGYKQSDDRGYTHGLPAGFVPRLPAACGAITPGAAHDGVTLELAIRVPSNARSMTFDHQFFSADYAQYVCNAYNDFFVVTIDPKPVDRPDGNIAVDGSGDPITVNSPLVRACKAGTANGITYACPLGTTPLVGSGFDSAASTGWLETTVGVTPGSVVTLRFSIWDSGDGQFDSTALLDGLLFSPSPVTATRTIAR